MPAFLTRLAIRFRAAQPNADDGIGGVDPGPLAALGVSTPVLSLMDPTLAVLSPDQAHEIGYAVGRRR